MKRNNLVIVAAGDHSLHLDWFFEERSFDLWVIYYGRREEIKIKYEASCDRFFQETGLKYEILRKILPRIDKGTLSAYRNVWLPDDDIEMYYGQGSVNTMFEVVEETGADIFQPAIGNILTHPKYIHYFHSSGWSGSLLIKNALYHTVTKAEIMMHGFGNHLFVPVLVRALEAYPALKAGWGLEDVLREYLKDVKGEGLTAILDCIPAIHTRAVSQYSSLHAIGLKEIETIPKEIYQPQRILEVFLDQTRTQHSHTQDGGSSKV